MRTVLLLFLFVSLRSLATDITFTEFGHGDKTYWIVEPNVPDVKTKQLIVFLHGHGASNPEAYGNWLLHLADQHYVVLFPKFQTGAFVPDPWSEQERIDRNIDSAVAYMRRKYGQAPVTLHFIGHSLGGLLAANIADQYGESGKYAVASLTLVQPGFKYLKVGSLKSYDHLDSNVRIACVTGSNDRTAGQTFANYVMRHSPNVPSERKIHFLLNRMTNGDEVIGSTHEEPVCPNRLLDGGNSNPIAAGADLVGKTDRADRNCFWKVADALIAAPENLSLDSLADLGTWADGSPVGTMAILK